MCACGGPRFWNSITWTSACLCDAHAAQGRAARAAWVACGLQKGDAWTWPKMSLLVRSFHTSVSLILNTRRHLVRAVVGGLPAQQLGLHALLPGPS